MVPGFFKLRADLRVATALYKSLNGERTGCVSQIEGITGAEMVAPGIDPSGILETSPKVGIGEDEGFGTAAIFFFS